MNCPLECAYLRESRKHDKPGIENPDQLPNRDIRVTEEFLEAHQELLASMATTLVRTALNTTGAVDFDVRDALAALIRTHRTLAAGIHYETRPENRLAAGLYNALRDAVTAFRNRETRLLGILKTRDTDVLQALVFLQHFEFDRNNGRKRGRAFLDALLEFYPGPPGAPPPSPSPLIRP